MKYLLFWMALTVNVVVISANDCIKKFQIEHTIDSLLVNTDTISALEQYQVMKKLDCYIKSYYQKKMAMLYAHLGDLQNSKKELEEAISKGLLVNLIAEWDEEDFLDWVSKNFGIEYKDKIVEQSNRLLEEKWKKHGDMLLNLLDISALDKGIRKVNLFRRVSDMGSRKIFKLPNPDSVFTSPIADDLFAHRSSQDSINLQLFVNEVLKLGYVPDERETLGIIPINVLVVHSAKFDYGKAYETIVEKSLFTNRIGSTLYGWYIDHKQEFSSEEPIFYFNMTFEDLSEEKIRMINKKRAAFGIRKYPATVWNMRIYAQE